MTPSRPDAPSSGLPPCPVRRQQPVVGVSVRVRVRVRERERGRGRGSGPSHGGIRR